MCAYVSRAIFKQQTNTKTTKKTHISKEHFLIVLCDELNDKFQSSFIFVPLNILFRFRGDEIANHPFSINYVLKTVA